MPSAEPDRRAPFETLSIRSWTPAPLTSAWKIIVGVCPGAVFVIDLMVSATVVAVGEISPIS